MIFVLGVAAVFIGVLVLNLLGSPIYSRDLNLWDYIGGCLVLGGLGSILYSLAVLCIKYLP